MWGDMMWMSRFDGGDAPGRPLTGGRRLFDWPELMAERPRLDARIAAWTWMV
jgi:hypothetical protein